MSTDSAPERYRRRSRWPALVIIAFLAIGATITWITVLQPEPVVSNACNVPGPDPALTRTTPVPTDAVGSAAVESAASVSAASAASEAASVASALATATDAAGSAAATTTTATTVVTSLGTITDKNTLADTRPANPTNVRLTIFNASTINGLARTVTEQFRAAGFESIQPALSDPLYPAQDLRCYGEIRYGQAGTAAARAVLIGAPCATLVVDTRIDDSVEFAIGALYEQAEFSAEAIAQLQQAVEDARPPNVIEGQTAAPKTLGAAPPLPQVTCPS